MIAACVMALGNPTGGGPGASPTASFFWIPNPGIQGQSMAFIDTSTGQAPLTFSWEINGNQFSTAQNPNYYPGNIGNPTVKLTVTNQYGSDSVSHSVPIIT